MNDRIFRMNSYISLIASVTLVSMAIALSTCGRATVFPREPEAHRLFEEVQEWPDEYYYLVASGVSSRIMGLRSAEELLGELKNQWANIEVLGTVDKLINYFRAHDLVPIAEAIERTLSKNRAAEPVSESHKKLQADAVKRGLCYAFWEVKGQPPG
jgi:hypothetical protein